MRNHDAKLQYGVESQSILMLERICNLCTVSIIVQNRIQETIIALSYIYFIY